MRRNSCLKCGGFPLCGADKNTEGYEGRGKSGLEKKKPRAVARGSHLLAVNRLASDPPSYLQPPQNLIVELVAPEHLLMDDLTLRVVLPLGEHRVIACEPLDRLILGALI